MKTADQWFKEKYRRFPDEDGCYQGAFSENELLNACKSGEKQVRKDERDKVVAEIKEMTIGQITDAESICNAILGGKNDTNSKD